MLPSNFSKMSSKEEGRLGLPPGFSVYSPGKFGGLNQNDGRQSLPDQDFHWVENFINSGKGNLSAIYDVGQSLYTAPNGLTIIYFYSFNISAVNYFAVFFNDGSAVQVNSDTGALTSIGGTGLFYNGSQLPACGQWGSKYLIIANNFQKDCYYIWDGTLLYQAGSLSPNVIVTNGGSGYSSSPTVSAYSVYGGTGYGATFSAVVTNGFVTSVEMTNPGVNYSSADIVQLQFSGGGSDTSAILRAVLTSGTVSSVTLTAGGSGYTAGTYALSITGGSGSGAAGTYTVDSTGAVVSTAITNQGSGYTSTPAIAFPSGGGSGAIGVPILGAATVSSITIVNGGTGYVNATPTITISGGGGGNAAATVTVTGGVITAVTMTNNGAGYTSTPSVTVASSFNKAASATVTMMPYGVSGSSIETYQQRVWLTYPYSNTNTQNGGVIQYTSPGSLSDFSGVLGGGTYQAVDSLLRNRFSNIKQSNNFLYAFGDSSVNSLSNVQLSGTSTIFNYYNVEPQTGTAWRDTCSNYSRSIFFANTFGVYSLYGGSATKVSEKLNDLFSDAIFAPTNGALFPSSAIADIFNHKCYLLLMTIQDPRTFQYRNVMVCFDGREWFIASQSVALTYITTQEVDSVTTAWGTDGTDLYPLFQEPSSAIVKSLSTKLYGDEHAYIQKMAYSFYIQANADDNNSEQATFNVNIDTEYGSYPLPVACSFPLTSNYSPLFASTAGDVYGTNLGLSLSCNAPDFSILYLGLGYINETAVLSSAGINENEG